VRYLTLDEVLGIYRNIILQSGGSFGIRDLPALESALAQPRATFGAADLYPTVAEKASALGFSLIQNHPSSTATNASATRPWKCFLSLTGMPLTHPLMTKSSLY
jgi:death-on-curing protein